MLELKLIHVSKKGPQDTSDSKYSCLVHAHRKSRDSVDTSVVIENDGVWLSESLLFLNDVLQSLRAEIAGLLKTIWLCKVRCSSPHCQSPTRLDDIILAFTGAFYTKRARSRFTSKSWENSKPRNFVIVWTDRSEICAMYYGRAKGQKSSTWVADRNWQT